MRRAASLGLLLAFLTAACGGGSGGGARRAAPRLDDVLHLNQVQLLGTHNSYHVEPPPSLDGALRLVDPELTTRVQYTHPPLSVQLDRQGVRSVELDVYADPAGGRYVDRAGLRLVGQDSTSKDPALRQPGFKVMHTQDIDFQSVCPLFVDCLKQLQAWSTAHPKHAPLVVLVEAVDEPLPDVGPINPGFVVPIPIGTPELDALDAEVRTVFTPDQMITPDAVRGAHPTLEDAVLHGGWPTLRQARGKVVFALIDKHDPYVAGHPSLQGRAMFVTSEPGQPEAAFVVRDNPTGIGPQIADLVKRGYLVRTRADEDTVEARSNSTARRNTAITSGAQVVSTDYPVPDKRFGPYVVQLPGGTPARCDPVNGPPGCRPTDVESGS